MNQGRNFKNLATQVREDRAATEIVNTLCKYCGNREFNFTLKLINSGRPLPVPKWVPQIKQICSGCGRFKKFAVQSDELIHKINQLVSNLYVEDNGPRQGGLL